MTRFQRVLLLMMCSLLSAAAGAQAQAPDIKWALRIQEQYVTEHNVSYSRAGNYESRLDVYAFRDDKPRPTLIYIHGGGWLPGFTKDMSTLGLLPFLQMGWNVVNVDYRPADVALAPAAVEDCLCALKWVFQNAKKYNFDTRQVVVMGHSAGGHLALTTGLISATDRLNGPCRTSDILSPLKEPIKIAAVVNWFGITDVADIAQGPNEKSYAVMWLGSQTNRMEIAKQTSPLTHVREGLPPVITVHGEKDPVVPYAHGIKLHEQLTKAKVANRLYTIAGGGHGGFSIDDTAKAYAAIFDFLTKAGINVNPK